VQEELEKKKIKELGFRFEGNGKTGNMPLLSNYM
jgi:hypothetical protein